MNNQAAQKMPKCTCPDNGGCTKPCDRKACQPVPLTEKLLIEAAILSGDTPQERRLQKVLTQAAAALSQTAGVPDGGPGDCGDMARALLAVTETLNEVFPQWIEGRKVGRECACDAIRFLADRSRIAAAPAASGGEDVLSFGDVKTRFIDGMGWVVPCSDAMKYVDAMRAGAAVMDSLRAPKPPSAASVSERLLALADEIDRQARECPTVDWRPNAHENARTLRALEQALTQQRGDRAPLSERLYRGPAHDPLGRERGMEPQATADPTPQPGAEALRELVAGWRHIAGPDRNTYVGSEASKTFSQVLKQCADELESLLGRGG